MTVRVAGPAALLVSKLHKIADREDQADRLGDKDALDILRLLQAIGTMDLAESMRRLLAHEVSRDVARTRLSTSCAGCSGRRTPPVSGWSCARPRGWRTPPRFEASCVALASELLEAIGPEYPLES